ncbi:hypothetical protein Y032_0448g1643 [Ancylostoma ceylanicum]|uniref:Uncharacterized protein n=1 Tax=Ancylostoma ceylanicum TaxID=53326 RepID=A0A016WZ08_9BILA|nr:hypothetical protein Y032_0448g1643 [Ancylostoma ceylanicum]
MNTPVLLPQSQQERHKRARVDVSSPTRDPAIDRAYDLMQTDPTVPPHVKDLFCHLMESRDQLMEWILQQYRELKEEVISLRAENKLLKSSVPHADASIPISTQSIVSQDPISNSLTHTRITEDDFETKERQRSIVVAGVPESRDPITSARLTYDFDCVRQILDHLSIEAIPVCTFRMGRPSISRPRLLKVVFPSTFYRNLALKRAHYLKSFHTRVFIRPSLSKTERDKIRLERGSKPPPQIPNGTIVTNTVDPHFNTSPNTISTCDAPVNSNPTIDPAGCAGNA